MRNRISSVMLAVTCGVPFSPCTAAPLDRLEMFTAGYPRILLFRAAEVKALESYEALCRQAELSNGIIGKVLDEEERGHARALANFVRYKREHPSKMVLLHFNGLATYPEAYGDDFFPGHFALFTGSVASAFTREDTAIRVRDAAVFRRDDLVLARPLKNGTAVWDDYEYLRVKSVDVPRARLEVSRGKLGTRPLSISAPGQAYLAAAMVRGRPQGKYLRGSLTTAELAPEDTAVRVGKVRQYKPSSFSYLRPVVEGTPSLDVFEMVKITAVNRAESRLTLQRALLGSGRLPLAEAGQVHVSAGGMQGGERLHHNYHPDGPRDAKGRRFAEMFADFFGGLFGPGGTLAALDGVQFDMAFSSRTEASRGRQIARLGRGPDYAADGSGPDYAFSATGSHRYAAGTYEVLVKLREKLGPTKILMQDMGRLLVEGVYNGIESEGWPIAFDVALEDWSGGMNEHLFWMTHAHPPAFSYIHRKPFIRKTGGPNQRAALPPNLHRLTLASAQMLHGTVTVNWLYERGITKSIDDELRNGKANELNWLGQPLESPRYLGCQGPDLYRGRDAALIAGAETRTVSVNGRGRGFAPKDLCDMIEKLNHDERDGQWTARLEHVPLPPGTGDCTIRFRTRSDAVPAMPRQIVRAAYVYAVDASDPARRRTTPRQTFWIGPKWDETFAFITGIDWAVSDIEFRFGAATGVAPAYVKDVRVYVGSLAMSRLFERGVVLLNPSVCDAYVFDLGRLYPGATFRRIDGDHPRGVGVNTGATVGRNVVVPAKDGLFLVRQ